MPKLRRHDLRHQFASHLVNDGKSLFELQQILGHSDPVVTMRYAYLSVDSMRSAAESAARSLGMWGKWCGWLMSVVGMGDPPPFLLAVANEAELPAAKF